MNQLHSHLAEHFQWYRAWHENAHVSLIHFGVFTLYAVAITSGMIVNLGNVEDVSEGSLSTAVTMSAKKNVSNPADTAGFLKVVASWKEGGMTEEGVADVVTAARARKESILSALANGDYDKVRSFDLPQDAVAGLPEGLDGLIEEPGEYTGTFISMHVDGLEGKVLPNKNFLADVGPDKNNYNLYALQGKFDLVNGAKIKVKGYKLENSFIMQKADENLQIVAQSPALLNSEVTTGTIKYTTILFNFSDDTSQPYSTAQVQQRIYGDANTEVNGYLKEVSYGKTSITGTTHGWYTIPYSKNQCSSALLDILTAAKSAASAKGVDTSGRLFFLFPYSSACGWAGASTGGTIGGMNWSFSNGDVAMRVLGHEIGHSFGINHAGSYNCGSASVAPYTNCSWSEYGDEFDLMGGSSRGNQFSAAVKSNLRWLTSANIQTVTQSGIYKIAPLETASAGVQALRIAKPDSVLYTPPYLGGSAATPSGEYYYLDYRQPIGADSNIPADVSRGAMLHAWNDTHYFWQTRLFDMTPGDGNFTNVAMSDGQTFADATNGITVKQLSHDATGVTLDITVPATDACVPAAPTVTLSPSNASIEAGLTSSFVANVKNNDSATCSMSTFTAGATVPSGLTSSLSQSSLSIAPGSTGSFALYVGSGAGTAAGSYPISVAISDAAVSVHSGSGNASLTVVAVQPDTTAPVVSITSPTNGSSLRGANANVSVSAVDDKSVSKVEFVIDGKLVATDMVLPYAYKWNIKKVVGGQHTITAKAYDTSGNMSEASVTVTK